MLENGAIKQGKKVGIGEKGGCVLVKVDTSVGEFSKGSLLLELCRKDIIESAVDIDDACLKSPLSHEAANMERSKQNPQAPNSGKGGSERIHTGGLFGIL